MNLNPLLGRIRKPVRREAAPRYLLITLLAFAGSVAGTRLFLELTGYPQLGGGEMHIAHVLWGGLFLFSAALLPLIFSNRWAYTAAALLAGLGVGLFIDEVGKFITQSNDYFYPGAAPIIYAFFLLTVMVYLQVRKPDPVDPRSELYRSFDTLEEVLDRDLEPDERLALEVRLGHVAEFTEDPALARLAWALLDFLASEEVVVSPAQLTFGERILAWLRAFEDRVLIQKRMRLALTAGLTLAAIFPMMRFIELLSAFSDSAQMQEMLAALIAFSPVDSVTGFIWHVARTTLEGAVGSLLLISTVLLVMRKERTGMSVAYFALLLALTVVDLLVFYFEQFSTIVPVALQLVLLLGVISYRRRFFQTDLRTANAPTEE